MAVADLTFARLREVLHYEPETGVFTWRITRLKAKAGKVAGTVKGRGYCRIRIDGDTHLAHRLAWLWITGCPPSADMDHRNGKRADNRLRNLRPASRSLNLQNQRAAKSHNKAGLLGVVASRGRYYARIVVDGKQRSLGGFDTAHEAHARYVDAKRQLHLGCTL